MNLKTSFVLFQTLSEVETFPLSFAKMSSYLTHRTTHLLHTDNNGNSSLIHTTGYNKENEIIHYQCYSVMYSN